MPETRLMRTFDIEDSLDHQNDSGIEVIVTLQDGERRWCYFMTLEALRNCGDWIAGTKIRMHFGASHMIVVATPLTTELIEAALITIDREGGLRSCTLALDN